MSRHLPAHAATTNAAGLAGPNVIENFTRVTTFGEAQNHWVSATIDANDPNVFTFHQHLVTANLPTYTAPPPPDPAVQLPTRSMRRVHTGRNKSYTLGSSPNLTAVAQIPTNLKASTGRCLFVTGADPA